MIIITTHFQYNDISAARLFVIYLPMTCLKMVIILKNNWIYIYQVISSMIDELEYSYS